MKYIIYIAIFFLLIPIASLAQDATPALERHEFVKRGDHKQELKLGDYVVVGVFKSGENAQRVADGYKENGFPEASVGYCSAKSVWFVCMGTSSNIEEARNNREKYRKENLFKDAWLLTVHE